MHALQIPYSLLYGAACKNRLSRVIYRFCFRCRCFRCRHVLLLVLSSITFSTAARHFLKGTDEKVCRGGKGAPVLPEIIGGFTMCLGQTAWAVIRALSSTINMGR